MTLDKTNSTIHDLTRTREGLNDAALLASMAVATIRSPNTRRLYAARIQKFIASGLPLNREGVGSYIQQLRQRGAGSSAVNQTLSAISRLLDEAEVRGLVNQWDAGAIRKLKRDPIRGVRQGRWLTLGGLQDLVNLPDRSTLIGKRDAAVLALLAGCGLRRAEAISVTWEHYQAREGRMVLLDFHGKGQRRRTVPVPEWAALDLNAWREAILHYDGIDQKTEEYRFYALRPILRPAVTPKLISGGGGGLRHGPLSGQGVWWIIKQYAGKLGYELRPHDLRRTMAKLMRRAGVGLEDIRDILGHSSLTTTEKYLGGALELRPGKAGTDQIKLEVKRDGML